MIQTDSYFALSYEFGDEDDENWPRNRKGLNDKKIAFRCKNSEDRYKKFAKRLSNNIFSGIGLQPEKKLSADVCDFANSVGPKATKILLKNSGKGWEVMARRLKLSNSPTEFVRWELNSTTKKSTVYFFAIKKRRVWFYVTVLSARHVVLKRHNKLPDSVDIERDQHKDDNRAFFLQHDSLTNNDTLTSVKFNQVVLSFAPNYIIVASKQENGNHWEIK